jgi:hypothetical protein
MRQNFGGLSGGIVFMSRILPPLQKKKPGKKMPDFLLFFISGF